MKHIEAKYAAYEISHLMTNARQSVALFAPDGWQFFSFENYPPILCEVAERRVDARFLFGDGMFPRELDPKQHLPRNGCQIRILSGSAAHTGYAIVDASHAIRGRYVPGSHFPYDVLTIAEDTAAIGELLRHFEVAWKSAASLEILFLATEGRDRLIHVPTLVQVVEWTPRLTALAKDPSGLFQLNPREFEALVAELLHRDGFETTLTPKSRDGGRDVLASRLLPTGPMLCLVECKRYARKRPVTVQYVRGLFGTVMSERASNGLIVTTSSFTKPARDFAGQHCYQLALKEYTDLVAWIRRTVDH